MQHLYCTCATPAQEGRTPAQRMRNTCRMHAQRMRDACAAPAQRLRKACATPGAYLRRNACALCVQPRAAPPCFFKSVTAAARHRAMQEG
eukprot:353218-Chlamydomonas_euryale.AAC.4